MNPAEVEKVAEYIAQQESHHRGVSFQDQYRQLLESHGIEYDERYVWDWAPQMYSAPTGLRV